MGVVFPAPLTFLSQGPNLPLRVGEGDPDFLTSSLVAFHRDWSKLARVCGQWSVIPAPRTSLSKIYVTKSSANLNI